MTLDEIIAEKLQRLAGAKLVELVCHTSGYEAIIKGGVPVLVCKALEECSPCNFVGTSKVFLAGGRTIGFSRPGYRLEKNFRTFIHDETVIQVNEGMEDTVKRLADQVLAKPFVDFTPSTPPVCADCMGSGWLRSFTGAILGPERRCPCTPEPNLGPEKWTVVGRKENPKFLSRVTLKKGSKTIQFTIMLKKSPCETTIHPTGAHSQVVVRIRGEHCKEMAEARLIEGLENGTIRL